MVRHHLIFCLAVAFASIVACGPDESTGDDGDVSLTDIDGGDAGSEAGADTDARGGDDAGDSGSPDAPDSRTDVDADGDAGPPPGSPVPVDFDAWLPEPGEGAVALFQIDDESQIPAGMSVQARVGDWMFDSGRSQWVVEGLDRTMSPCAFGGNVIDAIYLDPEGTPSEETVGEICLMANLGLTFAPSEFSVLEDGSEGRAVLAVNGRLEQLDFLNISAMAGGFLGGLSLELALEPSRVRPIGVTLYYALVPGSTALRVVTAVRNDGGEDEVLGLGHLVRPAGQGVFFNPLNNFGGYGYQSLGADSVSTTVVPFVAYTHETASWAYVPDPVEALARELPIGAGSATVAGVTATLLGNVDLLGTLLAPAPVLPTLPGILSLAPGESSVVGHHHVVGAGSLATTIDAIYPLLGVDTATVGGIVTDGGGAPVEGVRVTAVDTDGHGMNQSLSGADGSYAMHVPAGLTYEIRAYAPGRSGVAADTVTPTAAETLSVDVQTIDPGLLRVTVTDASGAPVVARLTVTCDGGCPRPLGAERDLVVDDIPGDFAALVHVGLDGVATVPLEPGDYGVVVSRGLEWSLWPGDATESGGAPVTIVSGETVALEAEIARVVDTVGALGGDFHVHALASSDSSVGNEDRVWNFVSDGLDVIVSTDHDFIVDHAPTIAALGLEAEIASFVGDEITTSSYGHINAFPLEVDPDHRTGGALDWGDGTGPTLPPDEVYAWAQSFPGEQVVQINHAEGAGTIGALGADVLLGISRFDAEQLGMAPRPVDPDTGDTGYWSDDFTAIELMNGLDRSNFNTRFRWWLTMLGRGFVPTGTAVTDTHKLYSDLGGVPRTFAFVSTDTDEPTTVDTGEYVAAVNGGRTIGTNGPFFRPWLRNAAGDVVGLGETISADEGLALDVDIDVPEWMRVDTIDLYINVREDIYSSAGAADGSELAPTESHGFALTEDDLVVAATGTREHRHYVKTVSIPLVLDEDAYVVVVVRGAAEDTPTMWPVVPRRGERPFAFSNPLFVDADGGGYDHYPLQELIDRLLSAKSGPVPFEGHGHVLVGEPGTPEWVGSLFEHLSCAH